MQGTNTKTSGSQNRGRKSFFTRTSSFAFWALVALILLSLASYASLSLFSAPTTSAVTTVPTKLNFQGRLTDAAGSVKPSGTYNIKFRLFTVASGGSSVWTEDRLVSAAQGVTVTNGQFSVQLGSVTSLPASLFASGALYLEIELPTPATATTSSPSWTEGAMTPRNQMATSAYAYNAETLDGQDGAYYLDGANLTGTISAARLTGSYTGITGTGALTVGSIASGFGTISTANTISGTRLISTVATGTAPLTVASTTAVTNLNADLLDGQSGAYYLDSANLTGTIASARITGAYTGITSVGTLTTGTWQGSTIGVQYGGTGTTSFTANGLVYGNGTGALQVTAAGSTGQCLVATTGSAPTWGACASGTASLSGNNTFTGTNTFQNTVTLSGAVSTGNNVTVGQTAGQKILIDAGAANHRIEIGRTDGVASTPYVDFHSGATATDFDARIIASGGTGASAGGTLELQAANIQLTGTALVKDTSTAAFRIQDGANASLLNANTTNMRISVGGDVTRSVSAETFPPGFGTNLSYGIVSPTASVSGDFDANTSDDIAVISSDGTNNPTMVIYPNSGSGTFPTSTAYAAGIPADSPGGITAADYTGDGRDDVAIANYGSATMSVYINNGSGSFAAKVNYTAGSGANKLENGDFDADGDIDIALTNYTSNTLSVFMNNGNGTFAARVDYATATSPAGISVGDFNNDNRMDIVTGSQVASNSVGVFMNNGNGTFAARVNYNMGVAARYPTTADLDGDGDTDIAVSGNGTTNGMFVLMNNGSGSFASPVVYSYPSGNSPTAITATDYNGDGKPELILGATTPYVFVNNGSGVFSTPYAFSAPSWPYWVSPIDYNGDGKTDILTYGSNQITVVPNTTISAVDAESSVGTLSVKASSASSGGLFIQGVAGQIASLLSVQNSVGVSLFNVSADGRTVLQSSQSDTYGAVVNNTSTSTSADGLLIKLGVSNASRTTGNYFVGFSDGLNNIAGKIQGGANAVAYTTTAADYAEYFRADPANLPQPAELVTLDSTRPNGTKRAVAGDLAMGVISTNPGFVGNGPLCQAGDEDCDTNYAKWNVLVSLVGQVPLKVTGDVKIGDALGASDIPGVASVATEGSIVGYALTNSENGVVQVLIRPGSLNIGGVNGIQGSDGVFTTLMTTGEAKLGSLVVTGSAQVRGDLTVSGSIETANITVNGHIISKGDAPELSEPNDACYTAGLEGTDSAGTIRIVTTENCTPDGNLMTLSFSKAFSKPPRIVLSPSNQNAAKTEYYKGSTTTEGYEFLVASPLQADKTYVYDYLIIE